MARWDEILSLPVQNPPTLEFSAAELVWSKVEGWRDNIDRLALIPFARVDDFVRGESANKDCPSRFHVEARRRRPPQTSFKQKVDGILEYILYWCSFGPDDHRKGGIVRPSRSTYVPKKKNAGRPNTKRGCTCHFIVKRLIAEPAVALIIYNQDKHIDKKGVPCHGPQDKKAEGTRAMFAPYISEDLRLRVLSLLYVGVSVETIMQRHGESVEKQGGPSNRDDLLTHRYVRRQERSIRRSTYELDADDAVSISLWVESHQSHVFFYEDYSDSDPFVLGIQTEWQLQQMIRFGNRSLIASDSRFGTNKLKYPVHSLVVFNSEKKAIPVAWIITPGFATADIHRWMRALYNRVRTKDPSWRLAGFIVDDPSTDIFTIRDVFQCSVLVSFWRVRHAWHKNLVNRCSDTEMQAQMLRRLGEVVDDICRGHGNADQFEVFMKDYVDASDFMDYFKAVWYPRLGVWTTTLKTLPLASQETCAAMELYHNQLKVRLLNEKDSGVYQRADWLVDKLGTKVHSYFWLDEYSEKDDFARYWKDEWASGLTAWRKAIKIPDLDVVMEGRCTKVTDQLDRDKVHVVWNPGSDFAICDCDWAKMGNLCEHIFKAIRMSCNKGIRKPSISLFQFNQALIEMLQCPPHDSLFRDHAVSLAIVVQKQLDELVDLDSSRIAVDSVQKQALDKYEQRTSEADFDDHNRESTKSTRSIAVDFGENVREETAFTEMEIDPPSSCIPPPAESLSVSPTAVNVVIMENGDGTTNDGLTDLVGLINDHVEDMEQLFVDVQQLPGESIKPTGNQNDECKNVSKSNTSDADMLTEKTVELQKVNVLETSGATDYKMAVAESGNDSSVNANTEDADMLSEKTVELQTDSVLATSGTANNEMAVVGSGNNSSVNTYTEDVELLSEKTVELQTDSVLATSGTTNNKMTVVNSGNGSRVHSKEMHNSDCEKENQGVHSDKLTLVSDATDSVMEESKSLVNCPSISNQPDNQLPPKEAGAHENHSSVEASLSDGKWSLTRCALEKAVLNGDSSHLDVVNGSVVPEGIAESIKASESDKDAAVSS